VDVNVSRGWTLRAVGGPVPEAVAGGRVPAVVPGCVHLDLLAAGLIADPFLDENEAQVGWIARADWRYATTFDWAGTRDDEVDLVAMGLDTVATVELNGTTVAQTRNMHRSYRFPVAGLLRAGSNELVVTFSSALTAAEELSRALGPRPATVEHPINAIRKMACNFGADWGPELITAGIWRPLSLQSWSVARLAQVRPLADIDGSTGVLRVHVEVQRAPGQDEPLTVDASIAGLGTSVPIEAGQSSAVVEVAVADAELWWPHGWGDQALYPLEVTLTGPSGRLDRWQRQVGFRTVTVNTTPDEHGTPFTLVVNGQPVFGRGVNWIPDDPFPARVGRDQYRTRLTQARDLNANLVRVWGGGIFESDDFYDLCDELGLLVWQDFMFNCACYAEEEPLRGEIIAEAREAVTRLSRHPSLAIWNGCNENLWGYEDWNWKVPLAGRTWGAGYYFEVLPAIVAELDPQRPYLPGSPYSMSRERHPLDPAHGTTHIWDVWNERDYTAYRDYVPRFCSEFGFQGPPTWATLTRAVHDQPLAANSPGMLAHEKAIDGLGKLNRGLAAHLPVPESFPDWHWATQLNQARAVAFGVQHFRSWTPICRGTIVWQLNDCWPVTSWAAIDGDGRRKPMWYSLRRSYRDRLLTLQPRAGGLALVAVNDTADRWTASVEVTRRSFDGQVLATSTVPLDIPARGSATSVLPFDVSSPGDPAGEVILADATGERAWWHFVEDIEAKLPIADMATEVETVAGGYLLVVTAGTFVRDLAVLIDKLDPDGSVDDMLVTLFPGERVRFEISSTAELSLADLSDPNMLRCANQLVQHS
jgi:beta-mannosidase